MRDHWIPVSKRFQGTGDYGWLRKKFDKEDIRIVRLQARASTEQRRAQ